MPHPEWPKTVATPEITDQIHELILEDCQRSTKSIAQQLGFSREQVGSIIHVDLDMQKFSAKWVAKCLNADQKGQWYPSSEQLLEFLWCDQNDFLSWLVTMDKTRLYHYDPATKQQSMEWWHRGSPRKNLLEKFSPRFFGIKKASSSLIIFQRAKLPTQSITHLCWFKWKTFWRKRAGSGKVSKRVLLWHDNAPAHHALATQKKLAYLGFQSVDHPPYSRDLAPLDYRLFPGLKKIIESSQIFVQHGGHYSHRDLLGRTNFCIFWVASKS